MIVERINACKIELFNVSIKVGRLEIGFDLKKKYVAYGKTIISGVKGYYDYRELFLLCDYYYYFCIYFLLC